MLHELKIVGNTVLFSLLLGAAAYVWVLLEHPSAYGLMKPVERGVERVSVDEVRVAEAFPRYVEKVAAGKHPERLTLWPERLQAKVEMLQNQLTKQVALTDELLAATREALR